MATAGELSLSLNLLEIMWIVERCKEVQVSLCGRFLAVCNFDTIWCWIPELDIGWTVVCLSLRDRTLLDVVSQLDFSLLGCASVSGWLAMAGRFTLLSGSSRFDCPGFNDHSVVRTSSTSLCALVFSLRRVVESTHLKYCISKHMAEGEHGVSVGPKAKGASRPDLRGGPRSASRSSTYH